MKGIKLWALVVGAAPLGFVAGYFVAPRGENAPVTTARPAQVAPSALRVNLDPEEARRAHIVVAAARRINLLPSIDLLGSVDFDAQSVADVGSRVSGRLTSVMVQLGEEVHVGQAIAQIEGPEIGDAIADMLGARARFTAATSNAAREQALGAEHLTNASSVEQSRAHAIALQAEARGAEQRLLAVGLSHGEIEALASGRGIRQITLRSPLEGEVVMRNGYMGQVVDPTHVVVRVADLDTVWVMLDVYERDLSRVRVGDVAEIRSESHADRVFSGRVGHVESTVDVRTRTARVRIEVDNEGRLLRPGQFVRARVMTHGESRQAVCVVARALTQFDGAQSLFVEVGRNHYELRAVEVGMRAGDDVEIVRGLAENDAVVTDGVFALKSELLR